jgi:hypothetical protein
MGSRNDNMDNRVSVVIPTYNRPTLVVRAVRSALAAISSGDEIIVIDDGSTEDTAEALRPFRDRIRYVRSDKTDSGEKRNLGSGAGRTRNMGINLAKCPLVTFLDDDDEWCPDILYLQRAVMGAFPKVIFSFSDLLSRRPNGEIVHNILDLWSKSQGVGYSGTTEKLEDVLGPGKPFSSIAELPAGRTDFTVHIGNIYKRMMETYCVWTCSIMVRKASAGGAFHFAEDLHLCEEWECFARLAKLGPVAYLSCELAIQDLHSGTRNTDVGIIQLATDRIRLLQRIWGSDEAFLRVHSSRFLRILEAQHLLKARCLIKEGQIGEAQEELKAIGGGPWSYRMMMSIPAPLIIFLIGARRKLRGLIKREQ